MQTQSSTSQHTLLNRSQTSNLLGKILLNPKPDTYKNIVAVNMPTYGS